VEGKQRTTRAPLRRTGQAPGLSEHPFPGPAAVPGRREVAQGTADASCEHLLIFAPTRAQVVTIARGIHAASHGAGPFVQTPATALPSGMPRLSAMWFSLLRATWGGSLLVTGIEDMPVVVQEAVLELLDSLEDPPAFPVALRLMAGTTVCLPERVAAGRFSARLYSRLTLVHTDALPTSW
jgi:transcriptional regulator of acetoin/glycerol metabolism